MHISEGILSAPVLVSGVALAVAGAVVGLRKLNPERIGSAGVLAACFFVASLVHVPIGPGSVHLILSGLLGLMLGWSAFPVILVGLALQAVFFQFGGITTLGVNTIIMALPAVLCHSVFRPWMNRGRYAAMAAGFGCGSLAILLSTLLASAALMVTDADFLKTVLLIGMAHLPVMVIEGLITAFCVGFILKVRPELLPGYAV